MTLPGVGPLARFEGVAVSLGGKTVLRSVDLMVGPAQAVGVVGPNGAGKTTLVRVLATLLTPNAGDATVLGAALGSADVYGVRPGIGMIGHVPSLVGELTLAENLVHVARLAGLDAGRVPALLEVVGLENAAERRADASSFGMRRRVEVARVLLTAPRLLLLDEAVSGLDDSARDLITALVERTIGRKGAVVMVSHDSRHLAERCDTVLSLSDGRLGALQ